MKGSGFLLALQKYQEIKKTFSPGFVLANEIVLRDNQTLGKTFNWFVSNFQLQSSEKSKIWKTEPFLTTRQKVTLVKSVQLRSGMEFVRRQTSQPKRRSLNEKVRRNAIINWLMELEFHSRIKQQSSSRSRQIGGH